VPKTILLDLDNTLLGNEMATFLPPYFALLQQALAHLVDGQNLQSLMYAAVQTMQANEDPALTNFSLFMEDFARRVEQPVETIQALLEVIYTEDYPNLQQYTTLRPEAGLVVQRLLEQGHQVVIATNPLFPATAIEQRIRWAGLAEFSFLLVTHMENSHFSKPNPRYYEEILATTDSSPATTWMVGDDVRNDIIPAKAVGLNTWWITTPSNATPPPAEADKHGPLADFLAWVEGGNL
jgi:HAD superfamily hydrolase (TIGR01549 family)